jgi:LmbE family N-acetylglucosaminyl deacetylase
MLRTRRTTRPRPPAGPSGLWHPRRAPRTTDLVGPVRWSPLTRLLAAAAVAALAAPLVLSEPRIAANPSYPGDVVVFYPEHPDDETLFGASAIRAALATNGPGNVYVVLVSQGRGATPFLPGPDVSTLTAAELGARRLLEFRAAMRALGVEADHVIVLPDLRPGPADNFAEMRTTALDLERSAARRGAAVTHVAHSYAFDPNAMHRGNGQVVKDLYDAGLIDHALFWVKPFEKVAVPRRDLLRFQALTPADSQAVGGAVRAYTTPDPAAGLAAIGYRSTPWYFAMLSADQNLTSYLHTPAVPG